MGEVRAKAGAVRECLEVGVVRFSLLCGARRGQNHYECTEDTPDLPAGPVLKDLPLKPMILVARS